MKRYSQLITLICILLFFAITPGLAADIAIIKSNNISPYNRAIEGFVSQVKVDYQEYSLQGKQSNAAIVTAKIKAQPPKLIFALGALAAVTAKEHFSNIPIIYSLVLTPENKELTGKNITGIYIQTSSIEQFSALKRIAPRIKKIGVLYSYLTENLILKAKKACKELDCELVAVKLRRSEDVPESTKELLGKIDALWLIPDSIVINRDSLHYMLMFTLENNIPFMVYNKNFVKAGALISPVVNYSYVGQQAGKLGQQILQGKRPKAAILPPTQIEWAINLHIAKKMRLQIPEEILSSFKYIYR